jgi:hypothetical protein
LWRGRTLAQEPSSKRPTKGNQHDTASVKPEESSPYTLRNFQLVLREQGFCGFPSPSFIFRTEELQHNPSRFDLAPQSSCRYPDPPPSHFSSDHQTKNEEERSTKREERSEE